jgi:hypothetical protein
LTRLEKWNLTFCDFDFNRALLAVDAVVLEVARAVEDVVQA